MKVADFPKAYEGRRIAVTHIAVGEAERLGFVKDTERLHGQKGLVTKVITFSGDVFQLVVAWDNAEPGTLTLTAQDEVDVLGDTE